MLSCPEPNACRKPPRLARRAERVDAVRLLLLAPRRWILAWQMLPCILLALALGPQALAATVGADSGPMTADADEVPAHQLRWRQWTVADGLPQVTVNDIVEARDGALWLATQDGISRFDGLRFHNYTLAEHPQLGHGVVHALAFDRSDTLWIGTMGGLARLRDNRIEDIAGRHAAAGGPVLDMVLGVIPHAAGGVWIAARNGLFRAEGERLWRVETALGELPVLSVLDRPGAGPLVVGHHRLVEDPEGEARELPLQPGIPPILSAARSAEGLWLGTVGGLFLIDANGRVRSHEAVLREIERIRVDAAGGLWLATDQGLWRRLPGGKAQQLDVPGIDARSWVRAVFVDRESTLWVGTQLGGLHRAYADRFRRLGVRDGLPPGAVWAVLEGRDGRLWAGTPDGLYEGGLGGFRKLFGAEDLPHPMVVAVAEDAAGGLWIGTRYGLAHRPPGATRAQAVSAFGDNIVHALLIDVDGSLLVAGADGLMRLREGRVEPVPLAPAAGRVSVSALSFDRQGRLWVGHDHGLSYREGDRWHALPASAPPAVQPRTVFSLSPAGDGMLASSFEGLFYAETGRVQALGRAQGLPSDAVTYAQLWQGQLWYWSVLGIGMAPEAQLQALLSTALPLQARVFGGMGDTELAQCNGGHQAAGAITGDRWLWCPSLDGLLVLDLARLGPAAQGPEVRFDGIDTPARRLPADDALVLQANERDLSLHFGAREMRSPELLRFEARLHGYDQDWQSLDERRTAYYTNLPPGHYRFELRARDRDGVSGPGASLAFEIAPHWYETWWARAAGGLALLALIWLLVRVRIARLKRQRKRLEARVAERTRALAEANARLEAASLTDPLTGLHNRRFFAQQLPLERARCERRLALGDQAGGELVFLHVDLDHFKQINDRYGHAVGDEVLREAALRLRDQARASDFVLRWGGEEFLLVGRDCGHASAPLWALRVVAALRSRPVETSAGPVRVTGSIGYAVYPSRDSDGEEDWQFTLTLADAATYAAKREGRDRAIGITLEREPPADGFGPRLLEDLETLQSEGWLRVLRGTDAGAESVR